ncbi:M48 family metallopeptidase [bacterium]|nr:M48 family metallopeptidase [bacterium]
MTMYTQSDISYGILRSKRSTADIVIERDGSIIVRAPKETTDEQIAKIVEAKRRWIYKALAEWRDLNATRVLREFKSGEGFLYLGRSYRLTLAGEQDEALKFLNGRFLLRRDHIDDGGKTARQAFVDFYTSKGRERIADRVAYYAPKVGVKPTGMDVRDTGKQWATCSASGKLSFHWKCMMAPLTIIDYIVVHELCHLHQRDHTDAFWNEVDKILPDYHERKEWLRKHGAGLDV